jgi:uncharacterized protein YndB with AHSA1/START domain
MVDINIDEAAPVKAQREIHIDAPPERVWATLTAIDRWPEWNPDVREAVLDGPLAPGSTFRWKAGPGTITSTLLAVDVPALVAWKGSTYGIKAVHVWRLQRDGGGTTVRTEESWDGLPVRLLRTRMQRSLDTAIESAPHALKQAVEAAQRSPEPGG